MTADKPGYFKHLNLADKIASLFTPLPPVKGIVLAGSSRNDAFPKDITIKNFLMHLQTLM
jgi:hypothetical protein